MGAFLYLIAIVWTLSGLGMLVIPENARKIHAKLAGIKDFKPVAAVPITIGILFLLSSGSVIYPTLVHVFGVLILVKGLVVLTMKRENITEAIHWWTDAPTIIIRGWGVLALCFAVLLFKCII